MSSGPWRALTHNDPQTVLAALRALQEEVAAPSAKQDAHASAPAAIITRSLEYLPNRYAESWRAPRPACAVDRARGVL